MKKNKKQHRFGNLIHLFFAGIFSHSTLSADSDESFSKAHYQTPGMAIAKISMPDIKVTDHLLSPDVETPLTIKGMEILKKLQIQQQETISLIAQLKTLFEATISEATQYHLLVSHIETRLQVGTTPGNPYLKTQEKQSHVHLNQISTAILNMDKIEALITKKIQLTSLLHQETQSAFTIPGAVEEDHANLVSLSNDLGHLMTLLQSLSELVFINKQRQTQWLINEKEKFRNLSQAIMIGRVSVADPVGKAAPFPETIGFEKKTNVDTIAALIPPHKTSIPVSLSQRKPHTQKPHSVLSHAVSTEQRDEIAQDQKALKKTDVDHMSLSDAEKGRSPIAIISLKDADIKSFKWYTYSAASRHLNGHPQQIIDIVAIAPQEQSHEIIDKSRALRDLMVEMGLEAKNFRLIHTTDNQVDNFQIQLYKQ